MRLLIVEDENLLASQLTKMVKELEPNAEIMSRTNSVASTISYLKENESPDLILMDIELGDGQCFEIFQEVKVTAPVIFTTAYDEHTLKAFKVNSIDYLLKPIEPKELKAAFEKYRELYGNQQISPSTEKLSRLLSQLQGESQVKNRFLVKKGQQYLTILTSEIACFESKQKLTYLHTYTKNKYIVDYTLDELENMLEPGDFFRINRQTILHIGAIETIYPWFKGKIKLELKIPLEEEMLVSRERVTDFKRWLGA